MKKKKTKVICVIAAGGSGRRLGARVEKPYVLLNGIPLIIHTLRVFEKVGSVGEVILSVSLKKIKSCRALVKKYGIKKVSKIVAGGKTRQESVYNGLKAAPQDSAIAVVHDCARPFTSPEVVEEAVKCAVKFGGAVVGIPSSDTIKRVDEEGFIEGTLNRRMIWRAQTPQAFRYRELLDCYKKAKLAKIEATDDSFLYEMGGGQVKMVESVSCNMKITAPEDLEIAEIILKHKP